MLFLLARGFEDNLFLSVYTCRHFSNPIYQPNIMRCLKVTMHFSICKLTLSALLHLENRQYGASSVVFHFYKFGRCGFMSEMINVAPARLLRAHFFFCL